MTQGHRASRGFWTKTKAAHQDFLKPWKGADSVILVFYRSESGIREAAIAVRVR
jgi:hypothetical protein